MPRITFADLGARPDGCEEVLIPRPKVVPAGYTPVMLVTEWLTLNCCADWACRTNAKGLQVRLASALDSARVSARFLDHPDVVVGLTESPRPVAPRAGAKTRNAAA